MFVRFKYNYHCNQQMKGHNKVNCMKLFIFTSVLRVESEVYFEGIGGVQFSNKKD